MRNSLASSGAVCDGERMVELAGAAVRGAMAMYTAGGDIGSWADRTPVHEAAREGQILQLKELIDRGCCVNLVMVDSITPLHEACLQGQTQCAKLLIAAGAQVDARNIDGSTPLCDACASGSLECVQLLLANGAKVNPPLFTASPLHEACMSGEPSILHVSNVGVVVHCQSPSGPHHYIARSRPEGQSECVRLLISVGANLEAHDCHIGTPLHVACAREHIDCAKILLNSGANVNAAKLHETALHHAAKVKSKDLIEMLIEFGGDVYARDNRGKKPADYTWPSSPLAKCFEHYEKTPSTLTQLCRLSLRKAIGLRGLEKVAKLNIPPKLIEYLSYN